MEIKIVDMPDNNHIWIERNHENSLREVYKRKNTNTHYISVNYNIYNVKKNERNYWVFEETMSNYIEEKPLKVTPKIVIYCLGQRLEFPTIESAKDFVVKQIKTNLGETRERYEYLYGQLLDEKRQVLDDGFVSQDTIK